jgi:hypothetical protein
MASVDLYFEVHVIHTLLHATDVIFIEIVSFWQTYRFHLSLRKEYHRIQRQNEVSVHITMFKLKQFDKC